MLLITSLEKSMEIIFIDYFYAVYSFFIQVESILRLILLGRKGIVH